MHLTTRSTTCHNSRIVCWDTNHALFASILATILLHLVLEHGARVEDCCALSSKSASECCRISVRSKLVSTLFPPQEELTVLFVDAQANTLKLLFQQWLSFCHSLIVPCLDLCRVSRGCEKFHHNQMEYLRGVLIQPPPSLPLINTTSVILFRKYQDLLPRQDQCVHTLCKRVLIILNSSSKVVSRSMVLSNFC